jgi:uncharacterized damage-inducible protein DinB
VNILEDEEGMAEVRALGARSVPLVSRGTEFTYAQVIGDVVKFLGLSEDAAPRLSPAELAGRYDHVLETAIRLVRQMPDDQLERELPNRPRSWRVLMHHVFQVPTAFLDMEATGRTLTRENLVAPPPDDMRSSESIASHGARVRRRFDGWWTSAREESFESRVPTYFGDTSRHEMLERTVWHTVQHTRQVASLLEQAGVEPDRPLGRADIEGLPLTDRIWDDA